MKQKVSNFFKCILVFIQKSRLRAVKQRIRIMNPEYASRFII